MMQLIHNRVTVSRFLALGVVLTLMAASLLLAAKPSYASTTFTVTNTDDSGAGSLRQAILEANATTEADTINFNIPTTTPSEVAIISPATALPAITSPVTIDGYSQPGASPNTLAVGNDAVLKIELNGQNAGPGASGLQIEAANSTVKGLVVNRWGQMGISISNADAAGNKVVGNYVGTDASGTQDLGNGGGVAIDQAPNNTIGGATAGERNIISGNEGNGIDIRGTSAVAASGNKVVGNYVGTDKSGTQDLGNSVEGVFITSGSNNTIGGATVGERNVISGNDASGVYIAGDTATGNKVVGNYVGTDASGTQDLGNSYDGVTMFPASNNTIGGATAGERNIISGNEESGIYIRGTSAVAASGNKVVGNYVGTDKNGTAPLSNGSHGVDILNAPNNTIGGATAGERNVISGNDGSGVDIVFSGATGNKVVGNYVGTDASGTQDLGNSMHGVIIYQAPNNTIGGAKTGGRNIISGNEANGIDIAGDTATGNRVLSNSIFSNGGLGIDLGFDGPTANDPGDADTGPNNLQNSPRLSSAKVGQRGTTLRGQLASTPNSSFTLRLFSNPAGTEEGQTLIGRTSVTTDASGTISFTFTTKKKVGEGKNITVTATNRSTGDTSEFSAPKTVVAK